MAEPTRKFIRVNLSTGKTETESIPRKVMEEFIDGRGYGSNYLYQELSPGIEPLSEGNKILMINGPLAGTQAQSVSRWMVCTRSPLTGAFAKSVCGADFGAWMRFTGYEFILIEGKAEKPVYINLTADSCQILDASEIWGMDTEKTQAWLTQQHGKNTRSACIGPAAEKLVRFAAVVSGRRTASRCGTGTVMGSKNLKAIAINAQRKLDLYDPEAFAQAVKEQLAAFQASKAYHHHRDVGTTSTADTTNSLGIFPVRNFRYGVMIDHEKIHSGEYRKIRVGDFTCYSCSARCGKMHAVTSGLYAGDHSSGPEYESIWAFTGSIDNTNIAATVAADQLCDDYGMDTITTGNCIGFAFELYEKGILTKSDTDGLELTYGNHEAMVALVKKIATREGIGDLLAEGTKGAAAKIGKGAEAYAMHVKGLEMPAYEPRGSTSMGFSYATSNIGGGHNYGYSTQEIFGVPIPREVDRFAQKENADITIFNQNGGAMGEIGINCVFTGGWGWYPHIYGKMLAAATGVAEAANPGYLRKIGEKIVNIERAFNVREGFSRKQDYLPQRLRTEPLDTRGAPGDGQMIREHDEFLDRYYQLRGWTNDGIPTAEKLNELGLSHIVKDMA